MLSGVTGLKSQSVQQDGNSSAKEGWRSSMTKRREQGGAGFPDSQTLLLEDDTSRLVANVHRGSVLGEHTGLHVAVDDDDPAVLLQTHGDHAAVVADRELPRDHAAGGKLLDLGEVAVGVVNAEGDEGVGRDGDGLVGRVRDGEGFFVAGGDEEEFPVGLGGRTGGGILVEETKKRKSRKRRTEATPPAYRDLDLARQDRELLIVRIIHPVRNDTPNPVTPTPVHLLKLDRAAARVRHAVPGDRVRDLARQVEKRRPGARHQEGPVAGPAARGRDQGRQRREAQAPAAAAAAATATGEVDAHEVGAQVRHEEELARGVQDGVVRVRAVLAVGDGARAGEVVGLGRDEGEGGEAGGGGDVEGGYAGAFAGVDGQLAVWG